MAIQVGTHDIATLLASRFTSANDFGLGTIATILAADLAAHNAVVDDMLTDLVADTTDVQTIYGGSVGGEMVKVDEYGRSATQKAAPGATVGFPLDKFQYGIGWTRDYMLQATPADLAIRTQAAQKAHLRAIRREIQRALFGPTNSTFKDYLINGVDVPVKALVNADSANIPDLPDGSAVDSATHTHYDGSVTLTTAALTATITDVIEHGHGNRVIAAFHFNDAATVQALTGFVNATDTRVQAADNVARTMQGTDPRNMFNRFLGIYGAAEVWIKPWAIQNYAFVWDAADAGKPLMRRQRTQTALRGLRIAAPFENYPLYAEYLESYYGFGAWTRTNGAALRFNNATYVIPTIS